MFAWWGRAVVRWRWAVLAAGGVVVLVGALWGLGVFGQLTGGGFDDPASESSRARARVASEIGNQDVDILVLYSSPTATVDDAGLRGPVTAALAAARAHPDVAAVTSWYDAPSPTLVSTDRRATYALVRLKAPDEDAKVAALDRVRPVLAAAAPVRTQLGGNVPFLDIAN